MKIDKKERFLMDYIKKIFLFICTILFILHLNAQEKQLSPTQKEKDFRYLYGILKENYPYFGVAKREFNIDWLANKKDYIQRLKNTPNDSVYVSTLFSIIRELQNAHLALFVNIAAENYKKIYEKIAKTQPNYRIWVDELNSPNARASYWGNYIKTGDSVYLAYKKKQKEISTNTSNISDTILSDSKIAVISIRSFNSLQQEEDGKILDTFYNKIRNYPSLIIDISDNGGGSDLYWQKNVVEKLLDSSIIYTKYPFAKNGAMNKSFHPDFYKDSKVIKRGFLPKIPNELLDGTYNVNPAKDTFPPASNSIHFKGKVYLLVSKNVFSSSEGFAQFCKSTKWAVIAGEKTGGDGIGSDPAIICLPESGILLSYPTISGLNGDGSLNFEVKTTPDIEIKASNNQDRLKKLIQYIQSRKPY